MFNDLVGSVRRNSEEEASPGGTSERQRVSDARVNDYSVPGYVQESGEDEEEGCQALQQKPVDLMEVYVQNFFNSYYVSKCIQK